MTDALEQRWSDLGEFIRDQRRTTQMSVRKLAERAGVSNPYLSQIERGLRRPSADILQQIAHALQISAESLYIRAGILDERDGDLGSDLVARIEADPHLTDDQKRTLAHVYRTFRGDAAPAPADEAAGDPAGDAAPAPGDAGGDTDRPGSESAGGP
ncbi:MAG TPA: helix-turn-helix transcriptional regulator [Acidimicrobiales bacterium]|nr:helix-turn-helix transcriptional regulator [Acidimicrobiales bacterium]